MIQIIVGVSTVAVVVFIFWAIMSRPAPDWPTVDNYLNGADPKESTLVPESLYRVEVSEQEICYRHPDGNEEVVSWEDLQSVDILTTDQGPMMPDVFWVLCGGESTCTIAQGANGENALIERLQGLPNFDNEKMIDAMSSVSNQHFALWRR